MKIIDAIKKDGSVPFKEPIKMHINDQLLSIGCHESKEEFAFGIGKENRAYMVINKENVSRGTNESQDLGSPTWSWRNIYLTGRGFDTNGYCKITNEMIIQWGCITKQGDGWQTYPITFPRGCYCVNATPKSVYNGAADQGVCVDSFTPESFQFRRADKNGGYHIQWMAIGF